LTRLGIDPWVEAARARLADLPKALAAEALAPMIARLPISRPQPSGNLGISQRLVELIARTRAGGPVGGQAGADDKNFFQTVMLLACLGLGAAEELFAML
jgi:hypothetical protein